jgi:phosphopantothenoylcysteine decarboxylase / phosphopantothenate---cysteine ligase
MPSTTAPRVLITAGPTHEPIDAVRFIGNRSSGRMGAALADGAAALGWHVTLLLGPAPVSPADARVRVERFRTCEDLRTLLMSRVQQADILIMAAAVADYRPKVDANAFNGKFRRTDQKFVLELEPTPDLLAHVGATRRDDQLLVGFALEPRHEMLDAARAKIIRKRIDMVVANPLETMDSDFIEATVLYADGRNNEALAKAPKRDAAPWVLSLIQREWATRATRTTAAAR